jgi:hypothetical protein
MSYRKVVRTVIASVLRDPELQHVVMQARNIPAFHEAADATTKKTRHWRQCVLARYPEVQARLEEIRGEQIGLPVGTRAIAARANVTPESLIDQAETILVRAMESGQLSAAVSALKEKGVLSGKHIERSEIGTPGEFDNLAHDELERAIIPGTHRT